MSGPGSDQESGPLIVCSRASFTSSLPGNPTHMTSLWTTDILEFPAQPDMIVSQDNSDAVVVGAGLTGLTTAVLLARAGKQVVVVEARHVGAGATGNTTGKLSVLQGTKLARIAAKHDTDVLRAYVTGNQEGRDWLLRRCEMQGTETQRQDDHAYAQDRQGLPMANSVLAACREAGLNAEWLDSADTPFPFVGGVRLPDQAQLDPRPVLDSLVAELESHGGVLLTGVRVTHVGSAPGPGGTLRLRLHLAGSHDDSQLSITTKCCVLATGTPIADRGLFFARLAPHRSYCMAFDVPGDITGSMFTSVDSPTRSVRYAPTATGDKLIVGGAGHPVGRSSEPTKAIGELAEWTQSHYPGAVQTHFWSAQDYQPIAELPYVGPLLPGYDNLLVATGFDKWGLTNGVAAALALSSRILGGQMEWATAFSSWSRHELTGIPQALRANLEVGINLAAGWLKPLNPLKALAGHSTTLDGGWVQGPPWRLTATSSVDGACRTVSPVCPHLGGIVAWNDADQSWDCPLHGSRFAPDGTLLEGPATQDLSPQDLSASSR